MSVWDNKVFDSVNFLECRDSMNRLQPVWMLSLGKTTAGILFLYFFVTLSSIVHRAAKLSVLKPFSLTLTHPCLPRYVFQPLLPGAPFPYTNTRIYPVWDNEGTNPEHSLHPGTQTSPKVAETFTRGSKNPPAEPQVPVSTPTPSPEVCLSFGITYWFQDRCDHSVDETQSSAKGRNKHISYVFSFSPQNDSPAILIRRNWQHYSLPCCHCSGCCDQTEELHSLFSPSFRQCQASICNAKVANTKFSFCWHKWF